MKKSFSLFSLLTCICVILRITDPTYGEEYLDIFPHNRARIPHDLYYKHDYKVQWWYFSGHLFDESGKEFGYELVFFVVGVQKKKYLSRFGTNNIFISHFALSDVENQRYFYADESDSGSFDFAGADNNQLKVWVGDDFLEGESERMYIRAVADNNWISLWLVPTKQYVLHGKKGYSRKSEKSSLISSLYISNTSLRTSGKLKLDDMVFDVQGMSWFDREISTKELGEDYSGWDWFAIQLQDGREIMLYLIRKKDGSLDNYSSGTFVYEDGQYKHLPKDNLLVTVSKYYISKKTGARYPAKWKIVIPSENLYLTIIPLIEDQEFIGTYSTGNYYWEGTCRVEGSTAGRAYVELTGYER